MAMATGMATKRGCIQLDARRLMLLCVSMGCATAPAVAGDWKITPTIAVNETSTDNVALSNTNKQRDLITDLNPGLRIEGPAAAPSFILTTRCTT